MADHYATVYLEATTTLSPTSAASIGTTVSLSASVESSGAGTSTTLVMNSSVTALLTVEATSYQGLRSSTATGSFGFTLRGRLQTETRRLIIPNAPSGTVNNIEDLPASPPDRTVYNVLGTAANREPVVAVYSTATSSWFFQLGKNTIVMTYINPLIGTNISMPDYANFKGVPNVPTYWDRSPVTGKFAYEVEFIPTAPAEYQAVPSGSGSNTIWRWKVEDLADPGTGSYALNSWPAHDGGPTWYSKDFYRPQVKGTVKFNVKKNKTRKQRSVTFNNIQVDHMWMTCASLPQPFTVIMAGIIHSYPTAKYGHYLLDSGTEPAIYDANKTGKDFFIEEGTNPRNVMLFQKTRARIAVNQQPGADLKLCDKSIKTKHTEKARPRMFYGVFNGAASRIGTMDTKYRFDKVGELSNYGGSTYFSIGRRVDRISDNRASVMSLWDITFFHRALSKDEITNYYQEISNYYQFKEYS